MRLDWMEEGLCRQVGGDLWHPEEGEGSTAATNRAMQVCGNCPVRLVCLEHALDTGEVYGVWGQTTPTQRRMMRRQRRKIA
ncbi:MAG: WhiB family transcriptional regulator [Planctomycetota bacterium]